MTQFLSETTLVVIRPGLSYIDATVSDQSEVEVLKNQLAQLQKERAELIAFQQSVREKIADVRDKQHQPKQAVVATQQAIPEIAQRNEDQSASSGVHESVKIEQAPYIPVEPVVKADYFEDQPSPEVRDENLASVADVSQMIELYMLYRQYQKALNVILTEISKQPERKDLRLYLMQVYAHLQDWREFEDQMAILEHMGDQDLLKQAESIRALINQQTRVAS